MIEKPEKKIIEHANGGKGHLILEPIAGPDILKDKLSLPHRGRGTASAVDRVLS